MALSSSFFLRKHCAKKPKINPSDNKGEADGQMAGCKFAAYCVPQPTAPAHTLPTAISVDPPPPKTGGSVGGATRAFRTRALQIESPRRCCSLGIRCIPSQSLDCSIFVTMGEMAKCVLFMENEMDVSTSEHALVSVKPWAVLLGHPEIGLRLVCASHSASSDGAGSATLSPQSRSFSKNKITIYILACESALILIRHGESSWNEKNLFTGCVDVPLTPKSVDEAIEAGHAYICDQICKEVLTNVAMIGSDNCAQCVCPLCLRMTIG
ncbi:hypothetical protein GUJ93_ZPchr0002g24494 [Zizania palustris]|uniref:Uncharacterized protein n=1 Tax=Zizania palustris TaxID=103762 RepID=A0A8J5VGL0_ZIZPA|nr:hypothetical protein GUJ93_ZPchr0002g24494 [Zizania palustris]